MIPTHRLYVPLLTVAVFLSVAAVSILIGFRLAESSASAAAQKWPSKVADWVMANTEDGKEAEFLVILEDQANLSFARNFQQKQEKSRFVRDALLAKAEATQAPIIDLLKFIKKRHQSFYIVNAILVTGGRDVVELLASRPDVARIEGNPRIKNNLVAQPTEEELNAAIRHLNAKNAPQAVELGVTSIRAPEVWATGFTGQGIVIAGADTGIKWDHNALKNKYRGWNGTTADHNYNWHDSIHSGGGVCGPNTTAPCDDDGHGTHTVGTVLGDDGGTNQVGVAPGAKFIGCRNMDQGNGTPATYIECMEWFLAPYPIGGTPAQGDPTKAPDITTNSWGCPASEGCSANTLQAAVEAQRAAGIMMVVAAGNSGSACSTVSDPPSFYAASYTVGAISASTGLIASFSSRGPATADGSNRLKPEITAPGVNVRSATRSSVSSYTTLSGTSMATPHVAGAIALLWSARPMLKGQIQQTIDLLNQAAVDVSSTSCSSNGVPNNVYGWGRLDVKAAVDAAGGCNYLLNPTSANYTAAANSSSVGITTDVSCNWMATSNNSWLQITSGNSGTGNGSVNYDVSVNNGPARNGSMTIAGINFPVSQSSGCTAITVNPPTLPVGYVGSLYNQTLSATSGTPGYTFSVSGTLPPGVTLVGNALTGTPTTTGTFGFMVQTTDSLGCTGAQSYSVTITNALQFYPLAHPIRLLDTRAGQTGCDTPATPISGGTDRTQLARRTCDGVTIPANAIAITGNITPVPNATGFLTLYPSNAVRPNAASSNFAAGKIVNNVFTVGLGGDGSFKLYASATTDVVVDVSGYFAPPGAGGLYFHPLPTPIRLLETRQGETGCDVLGAPLAGGNTRSEQGRVMCNGVTIPTAAQALVGNATVVNPAAQGFITLFPSDAAQPTVANGNYTVGSVVNTPFTAGLGADGAFKIFTTQTTDLVVDVLGYYSPEASDVNGAGQLFYSLGAPVRLLDSRAGQTACFTPGAPFTGGVEYVQLASGTCSGQTIPANASAVLGNVTTVNPAGGFLTLWPSNVTRPFVATSNFTAGQTANRHFITGLGPDGAFRLYASGDTDLVIDLSGYFAP
ncbi:MAG: S8 family serine peptidase [Acidobacteria bacterium]|nr:S8 family serine peptidase [Acidobacteriota bacterium]